MRCHHRGAADSSLAFQPLPSSSPRKGRAGCRFSHRTLLLPPPRFQDAVLVKGALKVWAWIRRCSLSLRQTTIAATEAVGQPPGPAKIRYVRRDHTRLPVISCMPPRHFLHVLAGTTSVGCHGIRPSDESLHGNGTRMELSITETRLVQILLLCLPPAPIPLLFLFPCAATLPCDIPWQASLLTLLLLSRLSIFLCRFRHGSATIITLRPKKSRGVSRIPRPSMLTSHTER